MEGWQAATLVSGITVGAVTDSETAWQVYDNASYPGGGYGYRVDLGDQDISRSMEAGWTLRARLRVIAPCETNPSSSCLDNPDYAKFVGFDAGPGQRFAMVFGSAANGDPQVQLVSGVLSTGATLGPVHTVAGGAGQYHLYELVFHPILHTADLLVDGDTLAVISYFPAWNISSAGKYVAWGSGSSLDTGSAHYSLVSLENRAADNPLPLLHEDDRDPVAEEEWGGGIARAGVSFGPVTDVGGQKAWAVRDDAAYTGGAGGYFKTLTAGEIDALMTDGWTLRTRLRVISPCELDPSASCFDNTDPSVSVWFDAGPGIRFAMVFGSTSSGDPEVRLMTGGSSPGPTTGPSHVVAGGAGLYHTYELTYDPVSEAASLFVDRAAAPVLSDFPGWNYAGTGSGTYVGWGSGSSLDTGSANYSFVELQDSLLANENPVAIAGPDQSIHGGDTVLLDGSSSFDDQTASGDLSYAWSFVSLPAGSAATLSDSTSGSPSFTADLLGTYVLQLVVTDEQGAASLPDEVAVSSNNMPPTADAGPDRVVGLGDTALLEGNNSFDPDGDLISFAWAVDAAPPGSTVPITNPTSELAFFTPDVEGLYTVSLIVSDAFSSSVADTVGITATGPLFAEERMLDASDRISGVLDTSFDAKGHRNSLVNRISGVITSIQNGELEEARSELDKLIEKVDGCTLRGTYDPKGGGQVFAADYVTDCAAQAEVYAFLIAARSAI